VRVEGAGGRLHFAFAADGCGGAAPGHLSTPHACLPDPPYDGHVLLERPGDHQRHLGEGRRPALAVASSRALTSPASTRRGAQPQALGRLAAAVGHLLRGPPPAGGHEHVVEPGVPRQHQQAGELGRRRGDHGGEQRRGQVVGRAPVVPQQPPRPADDRDDMPYRPAAIGAQQDLDPVREQSVVGGPRSAR
jgi:hypothetical protein